MKLKNYRYDKAAETMITYMKSGFHFSGDRANKVEVNNNLIKMTQLNELDGVIRFLSNCGEDIEEDFSNGIHLSIKQQSYPREVEQILDEEFSKEGVSCTHNDQIVTLDYVGGDSEFGLEIKAANDLFKDPHLTNEAKKRLQSLTGLLNVIGERVAYRLLDLLQDKIKNNDRIFQSRVEISKDGITIFEAVHSLTLRHGRMNIVLGEDNAYRENTKLMIDRFNLILEDESRPSLTKRAFWNNFATAKRQYAFFANIIKSNSNTIAKRIAFDELAA